MKTVVPRGSLIRNTEGGAMHREVSGSGGRYHEVRIRDGIRLVIDQIEAAPDWSVEHPDEVTLRVIQTADGTNVVDVIKKS